MSSLNPVVANAVLRASLANAAWHGNPYKCPYCGSTNGWTYTGECKVKTCGRKLPPHVQAQRINEIVRRKLSVANPQDIKNLACLSGVPVDILRGKLGRGLMMEHGSGGLKLRQKHNDLQGRGDSLQKFRTKDQSKIGFTLTRGKEGRTTERTKLGGAEDKSRRSLVHGNYVAYLDLTRPGRKTLTTHYKSGADALKAERIRKEVEGR